MSRRVIPWRCPRDPTVVSASRRELRPRPSSQRVVGNCHRIRAVPASRRELPPQLPVSRRELPPRPSSQRVVGNCIRARAPSESSGIAFAPEQPPASRRECRRARAPGESTTTTRIRVLRRNLRARRAPFPTLGEKRVWCKRGGRIAGSDRLKAYANGWLRARCNGSMGAAQG